MKAITFFTTLPNGHQATRSSKTKTYTHVLIGRCSKTYISGQGYVDQPEPFQYPLQWSQSEANATKAMSQFRGRGFIDFKVIPVEGTK